VSTTIDAMAADERPLTRRQFVVASAAASAGLVIVACGGSDDEAATTVASGDRLPPTPACGDDEPTPEQTEGPFFSPDSPQRSSLVEPGVTGSGLVLSGLVLGTDCRPIPGALLDFWQADGGGEYDNEGYRLRGHQYTDRSGRYRLATIVPGLYAGRTRHIHVKAQPPGGRVLTTQLYFPGEPGNESDPIFDPALLIDFRVASDRSRARFDFVLETA
jgi:protocatechuate 3,4-dioxygenase beta subunit